MRAIIVTGARDWQDSDLIEAVLMSVKPDVVIHGDAPGVDTCCDAIARYMACDEIARFMALDVIRMPAQWERDGKRAGPLRNAQMLTVLCALRQCGYEVSVEAFPGPKSRGTWDMVRRAEQSRITVNGHGNWWQVHRAELAAKDPGK